MLHLYRNTRRDRDEGTVVWECALTAPEAVAEAEAVKQQQESEDSPAWFTKEIKKVLPLSNVVFFLGLCDINKGMVLLRA